MARNYRIYCRMPAGRGLQRIPLALGRDETQAVKGPCNYVTPGGGGGSVQALSLYFVAYIRSEF